MSEIEEIDNIETLSVEDEEEVEIEKPTVQGEEIEEVKNWKNIKVELTCPKCSENFLRSYNSSAWSCGKCRAYIPRPTLRIMQNEALVQKGYLEQMLEEGLIDLQHSKETTNVRRGRPPNNKKEVEVDMDENNEKNVKKEKKEKKIKPVYLSEVEDDTIFDDKKPEQDKKNNLNEAAKSSQEKPKVEKLIEKEPTLKEKVSDANIVATAAKETVSEVAEIAETLGVISVLKSVKGYFDKRKEKEELEIDLLMDEFGDEDDEDFDYEEEPVFSGPPRTVG